MLLLTSLVITLIAPFVLSVPATTSNKPKPPPGYQTVYNTCSSPANLYCCNGPGVAGAADEPTDTQTGCTYAAVGDPPSVEFQSGYCPAAGGYIPLCCDVFIAEGVVTGCDIPNQSA